jgi:16S rRNA (cytidine1402-2'-O)-methyltransferase
MPLPGASSVTTALSAAGISGDSGFIFAGFLPSKTGERDQAVTGLQAETRAVVILEAPHRIEALALAMRPLDYRLLTIGRELTKQFEEIATVTAAGFPAWLAASPQRTRGEFVLVLHPAPLALPKDDGSRVLQLLLEQLPLKTAVKLAADITGAPRNDLYEAALKLKNDEPQR